MRNALELTDAGHHTDVWVLCTDAIMPTFGSFSRTPRLAQRVDATDCALQALLSAPRVQRARATAQHHAVTHSATASPLGRGAGSSGAAPIRRTRVCIGLLWFDLRRATASCQRSRVRPLLEEAGMGIILSMVGYAEQQRQLKQLGAKSASSCRSICPARPSCRPQTKLVGTESLFDICWFCIW